MKHKDEGIINVKKTDFWRAMKVLLKYWRLALSIILGGFALFWLFTNILAVTAFLFCVGTIVFLYHNEIMKLQERLRFK